MNIRDILKNPMLPIVSEMKENPKKFYKEWILFYIIGILTLFSFIFVSRLARYLPIIML